MYGWYWLRLAVVTVNNVAPVLTPLSDQSATTATPLTISAAFTDPGWLDNHTVNIDWGDGTTDTFTLPAGCLAVDLI